MITVAASNPFPGLRPFDAHQADLFFGRDEQIEELLERLAKMRFVAVLGTSGSGKSSLVRAGLIPALQRGYFGGENWQTTIVRPGSDPIVELAVALSAAFHLSGPDTLSALQRSSLGLVEFAREHLPSDQNLLIVIDQFEELIRYRKEASERGGREESAAFVKLLLAATGHSELPAPESGDLHVYVVLTMRSDFLGKCSQFRGLPEALNNSQYLVPRMTREQQREAIEGPLGMAGARITPQLTQKLLNDVGDSPDQLPVLQHALTRMWEQSSEAREQGKPIDLPHYESVGRMERALNLDADRAFGELGGDPSRETIARRLFQLLVEPGAEDEETRRPSLLSEIVAVTGTEGRDVRQVIDVFHRNGFVTLSEDVDPVVDISHESLIRLWDRLKGWVKEESDSAETYTRLANSAIKSMALYRDPELTQALRWQERESPNRAWAERYSSGKDPDEFFRAIGFLERSRKAAAKEQWMRRAVVFGLCLLSAALGVAAFVAWWNAKAATKMAQTAFESAVEAARQRELAESNGKQYMGAFLRAEEARRRAEEQQKVAETSRAEAERQRSLAVLARNRTDEERRRADAERIAAEKAREDAEQNRLMAGTARDDASAHQLFTKSRSLLRDDASNLEISTLLAIESVKRKPLFENDQALRESLHFLPKKVLRFSAGGPVLAIAFSPNGRYVAAASQDKNARVFEAATGQEVSHLLHEGPVNAVSFSSDQRYLATASEDGTVRVSEVSTGKEIWRVTYQGPVSAVIFSPDRRYVAAGGGDKTTRVFEAVSGKEISRVTRYSKVNVVSFSPDSRYIATGNGDGTARVFEASTGNEISNVTYPDEVRAVAFSADGRYLVTAAGDCHVFEVATGKEASRTEQAKVTTVAYGREGGRIATGSEDGTARIFDPITGKELSRFTHQKGIRAVAFSPDGRYLASASQDKTARLFEVANGREAFRVIHESEVTAIAFSSDGLHLATSSGNNVRVSETAIAGEVWQLTEGGAPASVTLSPDAHYVVIDEGLFDLTKGIEVLWHSGRRFFMAGKVGFSPDGRYVAINAVPNISEGTVYVFDLATGTGRDILPCNSEGPMYLSGRLSMMLAASPNGCAAAGHAAMAYSPDGRFVVIADTESHTPQVLEAASGRLISNLGHPQSFVNALVFSPDSQFVAAANVDGLTVFEAGTGREISHSARRDPLTSVAYNQNGSLLAAAGPKFVGIFDVTTLNETVLITLDDPVHSIAFSPDGRVLRTASGSRTIRIHDYQVLTNDLIAEACSRVGRNLTLEEWSRYVGDEPYHKTCPNLPGLVH